MILTCPACATRYRVAEPEFEGAAGRTVRCANCGYLWYEAAPGRGAAPDDAAAAAAADRQRDFDPGKEPRPELGKEFFAEFGKEPAAAPNLEPPAAAIPPVVPPPSRPAPARAARQGSTLASLGAVLLLALIVIAGVVLVRHQFIANHRPAPAAAGAAADQTANAAAPGLVIRNVAPARTAAGIIVAGDIANRGNVARDVPRLRIVLEDAAQKEVQFETVDPPKAKLQPGEVVHFEAPFAHPPDAATGVVVTFASS